MSLKQDIEIRMLNAFKLPSDLFQRKDLGSGSGIELRICIEKREDYINLKI